MNKEDLSTIINNAVEQAATKAAHHAAQLVQEQMASQFSVFGERLLTVIDNTNDIKQRLERIEDKVSLHETTIKHHFRKAV